MGLRTWFRSAITGLFVKSEVAKESPETMVKERVDPKVPRTTEEIRRAIQDQAIVLGHVNSWEAFKQNNPKTWDGKIEYPLGHSVNEEEI